MLVIGIYFLICFKYPSDNWILNALQNVEKENELQTK